MDLGKTLMVKAGVVAIFCTRMLTGGRPTVNGTGEQTRDYVFVEGCSGGESSSPELS